MARIRTLAGVSQRKLAKVVGCDPSLIAQIETDRTGCSDELLSSIAEHLGVPIESIAFPLPKEVA